MRPVTLLVGLGAWVAFGFIALCALLAPKRAHGAAARKPAPQHIATLDVEAFLWAIAQVETGGRAHLVGRAGERGRCQFLRATWVRYTNADFAAHASRDSEFTRKIERAHLAHLVGKLFPQGAPEPALLAAAWRHGPGAAVNHVRSDYAVRVANLYWEAAR